MTHFKLTWLWRRSHNYFFACIHYQIMDFWSRKMWTSQLVGLLRNSNFHIEFHSKLFIRTKNWLKNEMIKLNVNFFLWNLNQIVIMNCWRVKIEPYFQKSFWNEFFMFIKISMPNGSIIEISKWVFILMHFMGIF